MAQTNVQAFTGDVEIAGSLTVVGGVDKVTLATDGTNTDRHVIFTTGTTGAQSLRTDTGLVYNPSTQKLTVSGGLSKSLSAGTYLIGSAYDGRIDCTFAVDGTTTASQNKVVVRDGDADVFARMFRSTFENQTNISGGIAFRVSANTDNYIRFCSDKPKIREFLDVPTRFGGDAEGDWAINISGIASNAINADNVQVDRDDDGNTACYLTFTTDANAGNKRLYMDSDLIYDNTNNRLTLNSVSIADYIYHTEIDNNTYFGFPEDNTYTIVTDSTERLRIKSTGEVVIGTNVNTVQGKLHVDGDIFATGNITAFSDERAKEDIKKIENALDKIGQLSGYTYTMNDKRYTGLIAQEVLKVLPEAVTGSEETNYALAYGNMMGLVVESIKDLKRKIENLMDTEVQ